MSEWIKTSEKLPEEDVSVLIWRFGFSGPGERREFGVVAMLTRDGECGVKFWEDWAGNDISLECVTHWREFEPPQKQVENAENTR